MVVVSACGVEKERNRWGKEWRRTSLNLYSLVDLTKCIYHLSQNSTSPSIIIFFSSATRPITPTDILLFRFWNRRTPDRSISHLTKCIYLEIKCLCQLFPLKFFIPPPDPYLDHSVNEEQSN